MFAIVMVLVLSLTLDAPHLGVLGQTETASLAFTHANLIDGVSAQPLRDATVITRDARI